MNSKGFFTVEIVAGLIGLLLVGGVVVRHDMKIRKEVEDKWKPVLAKCVDDNKTIHGQFTAFIDEHNKFVKDLEEQRKRARDKSVKAQAEADKAKKEQQSKVDAALAAANDPTKRTKEEACEKATTSLRSFVTDLLRINPPNGQ